MKNSQSSVIYPEKFRKLYKILFRNRLYPRLLNSFTTFIELFFSVSMVIQQILNYVK